MLPMQQYQGSIVRLNVYSSDRFGKGPALNVLIIYVQTGVIPLKSVLVKS